MPYPEDFCEISGNSVWRKIVKFDDSGIRDPTLLSGVLVALHSQISKIFDQIGTLCKFLCDPEDDFTPAQQKRSKITNDLTLLDSM